MSDLFSPLTMVGLSIVDALVRDTDCVVWRGGINCCEGVFVDSNLAIRRSRSARCMARYTRMSARAPAT